MRVLPAILLGSIALLALPDSARAAQGMDNCNGNVNALPKTIATPGVWCVLQDLASASPTAKAINITSDNVVLDCNDFTLSGAGGPGDTSIGIYTNNHVNITVRHCNVEKFRYGLLFNSSGSGGGHVVEDNSFNGNTSTGIRVHGDGSVIRRNNVFNTGGSATSGMAWGIYAADSVNIADNTIAGVTAPAGSGGTAFGIYTTNNQSGSIEGNRVRGLVKDGSGMVFAIMNHGSGRVTVRDNNLFGDSSPASTGVTCSSNVGRAKNNIIDGFAVGFAGCGDGGLNDVTP